jgi:hypothetical protein
MTGWLNRLRRYLIISAATSLIMGVVAIPLSNAALQAYLEVETFAPWNMLVSYFQILTLPSNEATAEFPALRPFEPIPQAEHVSKDFSNSYSLTRGAAFYLRPITAVIDLVLHIFSDAGPIGFIFAVLQLAIGAGVRKHRGYSGVVARLCRSRGIFRPADTAAPDQFRPAKRGHGGRSPVGAGQGAGTRSA